MPFVTSTNVSTFAKQNIIVDAVKCIAVLMKRLFVINNYFKDNLSFSKLLLELYVYNIQMYTIYLDISIFVYYVQIRITSSLYFRL